MNILEHYFPVRGTTLVQHMIVDRLVGGGILHIVAENHSHDENLTLTIKHAATDAAPEDYDTIDITVNGVEASNVVIVPGGKVEFVINAAALGPHFRIESSENGIGLVGVFHSSGQLIFADY